MRAALAVAYLATGAGCLLTVGLLGWELAQRWRFIHRLEVFAFALVAVVSTCGFRHLGFGLLFLFDHPTGTGRDVLSLVSILLALPFVMIWTFLRLRAALGGDGDKLLWSTSWWLKAIAVALPVWFVAMVVYAVTEFGLVSGLWGIYVQLVLAGLYLLIAYWLISTQLHVHNTRGYWSVSGLALAAIFITCAIGHLVFAYHPAVAWINVMGLAAALFFNCVVIRSRRTVLAQ